MGDAKGLRTQAGALLARLLDALDIGVVAYELDLNEQIFMNREAGRLFGSSLVPSAVSNALRDYVHSRTTTQTIPPALCIRHETGAVYLRSLRLDGDPPVEMAVLREEVLRQPDFFRVLNARFAVTRPEFQTLLALCQGATNRQIAKECGCKEGTIKNRVHRLLERFGVSNRTRLADLIERIRGGRA